MQLVTPLCLHWDKIIHTSCNTTEIGKIQKVQSASMTKNPKTLPIFSESCWRLSILRCGIWVHGRSFLPFYFVSSHAHCSTCTSCCSHNAYCLWWGSSYTRLDSQREARFSWEASAGGSLWSCLQCWAQLFASFGSCSMARLESLHKHFSIFCKLTACTLSCGKMEEWGPLPAPQTTFGFYPVNAWSKSDFPLWPTTRRNYILTDASRLSLAFPRRHQEPRPWEEHLTISHYLSTGQ